MPSSWSARVAMGAAICAASVLGSIACETAFLEIPIETPIQPKMDVSPFQRVLIAGFVTGGTDDIDANQETVRLLRSQLRSKSTLKVIDADLMPLMDIAQEQAKDQAKDDQPKSAPPAGGGAERASGPALVAAKGIHDEKDLEPYERLFANTAYWRKIGEEYQNPLIVTGTVLFTPQSRSGFVQREQEVYDGFGRRHVTPVRTYQERKGFILRPKFVFIDGRTGATMYSETYREEVLANADQNTPALSSYFELMDRLLPNFLSALSSRKVKGTRVLLR